MSEPLPPPDRLQSSRERLLQVLSTEPQSARVLSRAAGLSEGDVCIHLTHLQKSLKAQRRHLVITPASCLDCHFTFHKRERLTRPGKCPICHGTHLRDPQFSLDGASEAL